MKHLFNFSPTVKYRQGSSFMFKVVLTILYGIPALMLLSTTAEYLFISGLEAQYAECGDRLEKKQAEFNKRLGETRPDRKEIAQLTERSASYFQVLKAISFSWSSLFDSLEEILPGEVRISRIRIRPSTAISLIIEGEAKKLEEITEFLRRLYAHARFDQPRLNHHALSARDQKPTLEFNLEVDYLPLPEVKP